MHYMMIKLSNTYLHCLIPLTTNSDSLIMPFHHSQITWQVIENGFANSGIGVIYATTEYSSSSEALLEAALAKFLEIAERGEGRLLYSVYYEQEQTAVLLDLAFNDQILENVETKWKTIVEGGEEQTPFMQFEERTGMNSEDDDNDN